MELNLLQKTELWVEGLKLSEANLTAVARAVADVLRIPPREVLVVDVRDEHIVLDILRPAVQAEQIIGKKGELLAELSRVPGVTLGPAADVHSDGVLGMIALEVELKEPVLRRLAATAAEVRRRVARRAMVFPSGFEIQRGMIQDTNTPFLIGELTQLGYQAKAGPVLPDDEVAVASTLAAAADQGYGLVITTGGVGAEDKDRTIEGILRLDPRAQTPWIVKYHQGQGRHVKAGVRIAVGQVGLCTLVALPGPNDEVRLAMSALARELLGDGGGEEMPLPDREGLAGSIAAVLRERIRRPAPGHPMGT